MSDVREVANQLWQLADDEAPGSDKWWTLTMAAEALNGGRWTLPEMGKRKQIVGGQKPAVISQAEVERDALLGVVEGVRNLLDPERQWLTAEKAAEKAIETISILRDRLLKLEEPIPYTVTPAGKASLRGEG